MNSLTFSPPKEWNAINTCWTCKYRKILNQKITSRKKPKPRIYCGYGKRLRALNDADIILSPDCMDRKQGESEGSSCTT